MCRALEEFRVEVDGKPEVVMRACGHCWQCRKQKNDDRVGRCLCEQSLSDWSAYVTLTYRDSPEREKDGAHEFLTTRHVQRFVRSLRRRGHVIRYFAVGEYGEKKGRAHFHVLLFGLGARPLWRQEANIHIPSWTHGHVWVLFDPAEVKMRYTVKYLLKAERYGKAYTLSKKPPLGHEFFMAMAARHVALGVITRAFEYRPPGADPRRRYYMTGATRRNYIERVCDLLGCTPTEAAERGSEWVKRSFDSVESWLVSRDPDPLETFRIDDYFRKAYAGVTGNASRHWSDVGVDDE